ncbi:MAG: hypothetical protein KGJ62_03020 [Armatimonadetes bacterium]|nr:hypothetical protein [Armatimonadota bacterium]MDE2207183.1 hypothetical protein [Armatimonadota bacterium]
MIRTAAFVWMILLAAAGSVLAVAAPFATMTQLVAAAAVWVAFVGMWALSRSRPRPTVTAATETEVPPVDAEVREPELAGGPPRPVSSRFWPAVVTLKLRALLYLGTILWIWLAVQDVTALDALRRTGQGATATIIGRAVRASQAFQAKYYFAYAVGSHIYRDSRRTTWRLYPRYPTGRLIRITYLPSHPVVFRIGTVGVSRELRELCAWLITGLAPLALLWAASASRSARAAFERKLVGKGRAVPAEVRFDRGVLTAAFRDQGALWRLTYPGAGTRRSRNRHNQETVLVLDAALGECLPAPSLRYVRAQYLPARLSMVESPPKSRLRSH